MGVRGWQAAVQALAAALVLLLIAKFPHRGMDPYIAFAFTGAFVTHLMFRPERKELLAAIVCGGGFCAMYWLQVGKLLSFVGSAIAIPGAFLGMGTLFVLGSRCIWSPAGAKWMRFERVRDAALVPLLCAASLAAVGPAIGLTPLTYDRVLYLFDAKFGGPPSWIVGRLFSDHNWLQIACAYAYNSLPLAIAVCLGLQWQDRRRKQWYLLDLRWLSMTLGGVGFVLYQICPAAGPAYLFHSEFPRLIPNLAAIVATPAPMGEFPRNGMPSLHVAWTILLAWNTRNRAWWLTGLAAIYAATTALATLGLGEHYLMDLVVAAPLALALQALWLRTRSTLRLFSIGAGMGITLAWLIALRSGVALEIPAGMTTWMLAAATVVIPAAMMWRLERAVSLRLEVRELKSQEAPVPRGSLATESLELS